MKILMKSINLVALIAFGLTACNNKTKTTETAETVETVKTVEKENIAIQIEGMTCAVGCAKAIASKLNQTEGIIDAEVVFDEKSGSISFDKSKISQASILSLINGLGDGKTYKATVKCNKEKKSCDSKREMSAKAECAKKCAKDGLAKKSCDSKNTTASKKECAKKCAKDKLAVKSCESKKQAA